MKRPGSPSASLPGCTGTNGRLATCREADIDAWHAQGYIAHRLTQALLRCVMNNELLIKVTIPRRSTVKSMPQGQRQRLAAIRTLLTD